MDRRTELLVYMGATLATIAGLFILQAWYASYVDVSVVHGDGGDVPASAQIAADREAERAKLNGGKTPIAAAKQSLATRGREAAPRLAPKPSDDLSAMSGWVYRPGFKPYEPRSARVQAAAAPASQPAAVPEQTP